MSEEELIDMLYSKFCNENDDYDMRYTDIIYNSIEEKDKEIERLNNIIDELEKCLDKDIELNYYKNGIRQYNKTLTEGAKTFRDYIKEELIELKEGK